MKSTDLTLKPQASQMRWNKFLLPAALLLGLFAIFFLAMQAQPGSQVPSAEPLLTQEEFEAQSGLTVRLIGVTGGGGMVDFRLKITDAAKAEQFLGEPENLPILLIAEDGTQILAADTMDEDIHWEAGGILFIMLPNSEGRIQPGVPVTLKFGELVVEPVLAQ